MELSVGYGRAAAYIAHSQALCSPFVLVDIGARGGIHPRWRSFEPVMQVFGFDAETLVEAPTERQKYFEMAVGDQDGECFISTPANKFESRVERKGRPVPMRQLDTLFTQRIIPPADFIKIDVEGYEPQVLAGARDYLRVSSLVGADVETTFNSSPPLPHSHLSAITRPLLEHGLRVGDFAFDRPEMRRNLSWPGTCNALFVRDITAPGEVGADAVLKIVALLDVYGLPAQARAILRIHGHVIRHLVDVDELIERLRPPEHWRIEDYVPGLGLGIWTGIKSSGSRVSSYLRRLLES